MPLAALLGDTLQAPAGQQDSGDFWTDEAGTGPADAARWCPTAMSDLIDDAPAALRPRLAAQAVRSGQQCAEDATALQSQLQAGQWLTTREGGLWRWDGYTMLPGETPASARLLEQSRRAEELTGLIEAQSGKVEAARDAAAQAGETLKAAKHAENETRQRLQLAYRALTGAQTELSRSEAQSARFEAESGLQAALVDPRADLADATATMEQAHKPRDDRPDAQRHG